MNFYQIEPTGGPTAGGTPVTIRAMGLDAIGGYVPPATGDARCRWGRPWMVEIEGDVIQYTDAVAVDGGGLVCPTPPIGANWDELVAVAINGQQFIMAGPLSARPATYLPTTSDLPTHHLTCQAPSACASTGSRAPWSCFRAGCADRAQAAHAGCSTTIAGGCSTSNTPRRGCATLTFTLALALTLTLILTLTLTLTPTLTKARLRYCRWGQSGVTVAVRTADDELAGVNVTASMTCYSADKVRLPLSLSLSLS